MSYCLNPRCQNPPNPSGTKFCLTCGAKLLLKERYRAIKPIGSGGFGRTFLGVDEDKPSKPRCAIKQFFPQGQDPHTTLKAAELFNREAERLDQLGKHPQIPDLLAHFEQDGHQYLIQEFIEGENLAQELSRTGCLSETKIRQLLDELLPVIQFVHEHQVIHRDIKPANIIRRTSPPPEKASPSLVGEAKGQLVLVDFGAAKVLTETALAGTGTVIGSPEYVAPEQIRGHAVFASDLYSLGVTCIHLLTQVSPFELFDINLDRWVWRDYLSGRPVSNQLGNVLDKMLESNLNRRYQSAAEILNSLHPQGMAQAGNPPIPAVKSPATLPQIPTSMPVTQPVSTVKVTPRRSPTWKCIHTLTGHFNAVTSVAFSPDGQILASGSEDKTIEIWRLNSGKRWYTLTDHPDWILCVAFSPDGQVLASGSRDKTIEMWDLNKGKWWYTLRGHSDKVYAVAFSPDGQFLASGSRDKTVQVWNLNKGKWFCTLTGHSEGIQAVAFSPDGQFVASGSRDHAVFVWEVANGKLIFRLTDHQDWVSAVAFNPHPPLQGAMLASSSRDGTVKLWSIYSGQGSLRQTLKAEAGEVLSVAFSPDGQILASSNEDGNLYLWEVKSGDLLEILSGHGEKVSSIAFSPDGRSLASGSSDRTIKIWRPVHP
ncbi:MAG: protein kinase domain-containing protein [Actinomycetota bacterium]